MIATSALLLGCAAQRAAADRTTLATQLDAALGRGQTGEAHYAARVIDLQTGRELYAVNADVPYTPASNGKLAVSAATLDFFGPDHRFKTYLAVDGDDLWLIGTGDPGPGDANLAKKAGGTTMTVLDQWADALKKRDVQRIKGNLYYFDRAFDDQWTNPTWTRGYITEWYAAPISGLNFNNNCVDIKVIPTAQGEPVNFTVVPPAEGVSFQNKCVTGKGDEPDVGRERDKDVFIITGATTRPRDLKSEAVINPGAFFADALRTRLAEKGIKIGGEIVRADKPLGGKLVPPAEKTVAIHETKLSDGLGRINKQSQNNFAEGYCKLLGRAYRAKQKKNEPGSWPAGAEATRAFLAKHKIDASKIEIIDGSGLSKDNRVTARMISDLLKTMWKHKHKEAFFDSLSIAGEDGTIASRMKDLKGRVHAKTGFIGGVRALSGYVQSDAGKWLAFSIIYNGLDGSVKPFEERQDNACRILAAWPKTIDLPAIKPATTRSGVAGQ
ncbi:MAG: D-alanyl-D-alanine carboxypeptidase/D-alanyl-D-alanine-endopeptidase [Tepidisphaeraceae bacterium]